MQQEPSTDHVIALNQALVDNLKNKKLIQTSPVEEAFRSVLRHLFLPGAPLEKVYSDSVIPTKQDPSGQWISSSSQPAIMAIMLEQLGLEPGQRVLEIGTGTGYNAALMAHIVGTGGHVVTIDIDEDLVDTARENLRSAGFEQVQLVCADGGYGYPDAAPFDRIILTVGSPDITPAWWKQLKPGGRIVLPLLLRGAMKSIAFEKTGDHLVSLSVNDCGFIPLRGDFASEPSYRVPLGPDPGLYIEAMEEFSIDRHAIYALLTGSSSDWAANADVTAWEALNGSLWTWLALHDPQMGKLVAEGELVERKIVPPLIGIDGKQKSTGTTILLDKTGLAALMRPPEQPVPMAAVEKLFVPDSPAGQPFPLFVRQFGLDESTAQRLLAYIQAWQDANRPSSDTMHVLAYPKDVDYQPGESEFLIEKQWTKLVIAWPPSPDVRS